MTTLLAVVAAVFLAVTGHADVATAVAAVGGAVAAAGGIRVIVHIKR